MIVCHCQSISSRDIDTAIDWMRAADPNTLITPGKVYRALGKRADCGGCMPLFLSTMRSNGNMAVPRLGRVEHDFRKEETHDARRHESHRISEHGPAQRTDRG